MIYVTGDTHGARLSGFMSYEGYIPRLKKASFPEQAEMTKDDYVVICGDFGGVWHKGTESKEEKYNLDWLDGASFTTLFVPGNHENYDRLTGLKDEKAYHSWLFKQEREAGLDLTEGYPRRDWHGGKVRVIRPSVLMLETGYVFQIDGCKCFAFGGARSHDIQDGILDPLDLPDQDALNRERHHMEDTFRNLYRVKYTQWWPQEMPTEEDFERGRKSLSKNQWKVDFIITHDCPASDKILYLGPGAETDALNRYFEEVKQKTDYKRWFFGHMHDDRQITEKDILLYHQIIRIH